MRREIGRAEGQPAHQNRRQRFGIDLQAIGTDLHVNATGIPEARVSSDEGVVGRLHEHANLYPLAIALKGKGHHFAHRDLAVVDRRADIQRAQVAGDKNKALALFVIGDRRRQLQADKGLFRHLRLAGIGPDETARKQRVHPGNPAHADARSHHPEARSPGSE
ncbi:hypothetical protein D3C80_987310 [compost metagenome]